MGKMIDEMQNENNKANYDDYLVSELSLRITINFGKNEKALYVLSKCDNIVVAINIDIIYK